MSYRDEQPNKEVFRLLPKIINGGVGGMVSLACVFPLDLVKTRLQNQQTSLGIQEYSSMKLTLFREMLAGMSAGCCAILITTPMELVKIQMQDAGRVSAQRIKSGKPAIDSRFLTVVTTILKSGGPLGFYKGYAATFWRDVPFTTMYFPMFAKLRAACFRLADSTGPYTQLWVNLFSGTTVGCIGAVLVTPADVMKTRLQTTTKGQGEKAYKGIMDAIVTIMKHEGPTAFFKGGACRAMVIGPVYGIAQLVYFIGIGEYLLGVDKTN